MMWRSDDLRTPREALEAVQRARREAGLPDYSVFCDELLQWVSRGSISADCAMAWAKLWIKEEQP